MTPSTVTITGRADMRWSSPVGSASLDWNAPYPVPSNEAPPPALVLGPFAEPLNPFAAVPPWAGSVSSRIKELAQLPADPRGADPLDPDDTFDALTFLTRVMRPETHAPWIGRLSSGGIQLTWRGEDVEVEAVFDRARNEHNVIVVDRGEEWEASPAAAVDIFARVADRISDLPLGSVVQFI